MPNDLQLSDQDEVLLESLVLAASDNVARAPASDRDQYAPERRRAFVETSGAENVYLGTGSAWVDVSENTGLLSKLFSGGDGNFDSVKTEELSNAHYASAYGGANGGEQIQNAIDAAAANSTHRVVVVDGDGPDTNARWEVGQAIKYPDNITVIYNNAYLYKQNQTNQPLHRNADYTNGNDNITIKGNNTVWDNNGDNQSRSGTESFWKENTSLHTEGGCDNFTIDAPRNGITVRNTQAWGMSPHDISNFYISGIRFDQPEKINRDGVHVVGPATNGVVEHITGETYDDTVVADAGGDTSDTDGEVKGPVTDVTFQHVDVDKQDTFGGAKVLTNGTYVVDNVVFRDCTFRNVGNRVAEVLSGSTTDTPSRENLTRVRFESIHATIGSTDTSCQGIFVRAPAERIEVDGYELTGDVFRGIRLNDGIGVAYVENTTITRSSNLSNTAGTGLYGGGYADELHIKGLHGENLIYTFNAENSVPGTASNITGENTSEGTFNERDGTLSGGPNLVYDATCDGAEGFLPMGSGSVVLAKSSWDPFGTGEDELVTYAGSLKQLS